MLRSSSLVFTLALSLALAASALANDFYQRPPVPSAHDNIKPDAKSSKLPPSWRNLKGPGRIVKNPKQTGANAKTTTSATAAQ
ncbi:MAG: hypothetical protein P4L39_11140 [Humidesulfovibrio sp.]|nr:hypothetical protein [Humidesulfovibrio sp.]